MKHCTGVIAAAALCTAVCVPSIARAAGLGNLTYTQQEVGHGIALFNAANMPNGPSGADSVIMVHGLLVVLGTKDSGVSPGTFHVYDVKDPRNPALLKTFTSPQTAHLAEWHMAGMAKVNGKDILVCRTTTGIAFFDFTDPMNPADVSMLDLMGVSGGDYTNAAWMNSWSWPYVFTGSSGSGINITDATDPSKPVLIKTIPIGQTGNFRVGGLYAAGNYLVITNMDESPLRASVLDVSNPKAPSLLTTTTAPNGAYSMVVIGDWIFGSGDGAHYTFMKWSPTGIQIVDQKVFGADKGAYCTYQDGFGICGQSSEGFKKIDLHDPTNIHVVTQGVLSQAQAEGGDFDFATVMGNLVFQGNDHGSGNGFLPHQAEPDTTPPDVYKIYPPDQSTKQPLSTRITIFFTDEIDTDTVNSNNIIVRKSGGSAISGNFSHSSTNAISFGPAQPLDANSTYEIVVTAGGVADLVGNAIAGQTIARFSTGASVAAPLDGGAAGSGPNDDAGSVGVGGTADMGSGGAGIAAGSGGAPGNGDSAGSVDTGGGNGGGGTAALTGNGATANSNGGCACSVPGRRPSGGRSFDARNRFRSGSLAGPCASSARSKRELGMKLQVAALGVALTGPLAARAASALTITMQPAAAVTTGKEQNFQIAKVDDAVGNVTFKWDFGDGATFGPAPDMQATHTYKDAGHYTVIVMGTDDAGGSSASFVQTANHPLTARPPHNSSTILVDAERHRVWNVNPDSDSVSEIDADALKRVREVRVGAEPQTLAQAPDGTIWVTNKMSDEVVVLNRDNATIEARIALPYASQPSAIAFGPNGMAYVSLYATGKLVEIDASTRKVGRQVMLGPTPAGVSVGDDGRIFVTRFVSPVDHGEIWVVSSEGMVVVNTIVLPFDKGPDSSVGGRGVPNFVSSIAISPDGTQAWVTAKKDDVARGPKRDGLPMNSDNFVRSIVCAIDLKTEMETVERRQDLDNRSMPAAVVFSPIGDYAYISLVLNNEVSFSDAYVAFNVGAIRSVGSAPDGLALAPDGKLFANAFLSREVIAYDLGPSLASLDQGAPPPLARIRTIDQEPLSEQILLGKQVFFNAMDPRMSAVGYMSCASCHLGGISDGRVWDFTDRGEGLRNTKSLLGVRGVKGEGRLHWSANMDEVQDFERDIRDSQGGTGFMSDEEFNARKDASGTYDTFGKAAAGVSKELDALSAFVTSLDKVPRSPFRNPDGSFTSDALAGRKIFQSANCAECHLGPDFTDSSLSPSGPVHDVGTILPTSGNRLGGKLAGIDTPTLKGVWQSAPYLHDGRAETLTEIFTKYVPKDMMGTTSNLSEAELAQLVRYLQELDDVPETTVVDAAPNQGSKIGCTMGPLGSNSRTGSMATWVLTCACAAGWMRRRRC